MARDDFSNKRSIERMPVPLRIQYEPGSLTQLLLDVAQLAGESIENGDVRSVVAKQHRRVVLRHLHREDVRELVRGHGPARDALMVGRVENPNLGAAVLVRASPPRCMAT